MQYKKFTLPKATLGEVCNISICKWWVYQTVDNDIFDGIKKREQAIVNIPSNGLSLMFTEMTDDSNLSKIERPVKIALFH